MSSINREPQPPAMVNPVKNRTVIFKHFIDMFSRNTTKVITIFPFDLLNKLFRIHNMSREEITYNFNNDGVSLLLRIRNVKFASNLIPQP